MDKPTLDARTALLLIDVQQGFEDEDYWGGGRNNPGAEANIAVLLDAWRRAGQPVIHVRHASTNPNSPLHPDHPGHAVRPEALSRPGEPVVIKNVNSAFIGTTLEQDLRGSGITGLVIVGLTTNHCVSTTARMAGNLGFRTAVVSDATAAYDRVGPDGTLWAAETVHAVSLASLHGEFATVVSTASALESLRAGSAA